MREHRDGPLIPTPAEPVRHSWAELLTVVGAIRRLAYDRTLAPDDAMRRIRDAFDVYDGRADGAGSSQ